jgi:phage gpG-like protein
MLTLEIGGDDTVAEQLADLPPRVRQALREELTGLSDALLARVQQKLSGEVLAARSGRLRDSVRQEPAEGDITIAAAVVVPASVPYAAIQEFGGTTPAHAIVPRKGEALRFVAGGKAVFARRVAHPGSRIPERPYLRAALAEMENDITAGLGEAVAEAAAEWRE